MVWILFSQFGLEMSTPVVQFPILEIYLLGLHFMCQHFCSRASDRQMLRLCEVNHWVEEDIWQVKAASTSSAAVSGPPDSNCCRLGLKESVYCSSTFLIFLSICSHYLRECIYGTQPLRVLMKWVGSEAMTKVRWATEKRRRGWDTARETSYRACPFMKGSTRKSCYNSGSVTSFPNLKLLKSC